MARMKPSTESEESGMTPKPTPKQTVGARQQPNIISKETVTQPKRRTLQDRRPALKELRRPIVQKITTKPIYDKANSITTEEASETKGAVIKPIGTLKQRAQTPKPLPQGRSVGDVTIAKARQQQEQAIDEARAAHIAKQREETDTAHTSEEGRREREEASYRLSLDNKGRYYRKR